MATAEKKPVTTDYTLVLTLDKNEAETLYAITGMVGGTPEKSRRRFVDNIRYTLYKAGVADVHVKLDHTETYGGIFFANEEING
jgi:hypothetical protein